MPVITDSPITLNTEYLSTFSLAAQQNAYPLFHSIRLNYSAFNPQPTEEPAPLRKLVIRLTSTPDFFTPEEWLVDEITPSQSITLQQRPLNIPLDLLFKLTEEMKLVVTFTISSTEAPFNVYLKKEILITVLPANFWGGESRQLHL
jgi:hypothetical protein